jgi:hypothetical protein
VVLLIDIIDRSPQFRLNRRIHDKECTAITVGLWRSLSVLHRGTYRNFTPDGASKHRSSVSLYKHDLAMQTTSGVACTEPALKTLPSSFHGSLGSANEKIRPAERKEHGCLLDVGCLGATPCGRWDVVYKRPFPHNEDASGRNIVDRCIHDTVANITCRRKCDWIAENLGLHPRDATFLASKVAVNDVSSQHPRVVGCLP